MLKQNEGLARAQTQLTQQDTDLNEFNVFMLTTTPPSHPPNPNYLVRLASVLVGLRGSQLELSICYLYIFFFYRI